MTQTIILKDCLALAGVTKTFATQSGAANVLNEITYQFEPGVSYAITGASGSGKSTLLHLLAGFEAPDDGDVLWAGAVHDKLSERQRDRFVAKKLGFVFQFHYLIKELTVVHNIMLAGQIQGIDERASMAQAEQLLCELSLSALAERYPHQLSGGQQQRVALARALMGDPQFVLADEPTGNLDEKHGAQVIDVLCRLQKERGCGLIIATHDAAVCKKMDVVLTIHNGTLEIA